MRRVASSERVWEAEQIRLECFRRAIEIARGQAARSWELRAASSLARLLVAVWAAR